ncbi:UNVERIFIED_CONTAM: hypothetical protein H355_005769 [Colinus virginianus]|nr:hypothetical protein H355_005769 [Colinus virginianus]
MPVGDETRNPAALTQADMDTLQSTQESHQYQAEVTRLLDLIVHALYTERDVFLRELISNAVDALEKVRFMALSDSRLLEPKSQLDVRLEFDPTAKTLSVIDTGIGMTKQDLINNLGTVAKSGTTNFLEAMAQGADVNLIGQFGVGFYSAFLVADKVTVVTKHPEDEQYIWESSADAKFQVAKDPRGNTLGRGTCVTMHMKEDATEYLNDWKLKDLATKFSQFVSYPIYVRVTKTVDEEVPVEETTEEEGKAEAKEGKEEGKEEDDVEVKEGEEGEEGKASDKPKTKTVSKQVDEWEQVNTQKAIWLRPKEEITQKDYDEFYKSITKDWSDSLAHIHFTAEGEVEFKALLYIPKRAPSDIYSSYFDKQTNIKVYVRRVLVADQFDNILPKYLHFIKGVVDSDDLPLNVSREHLQQQKILNVISKKLVRKTLETLRKLAVDSEKERENTKKELAETEDEEKKKELEKSLKEKSLFDRFYDEFARNIKLGCYEDDANRNKLVKLMRFYTSKSVDEMVPIETIVANMPEGQQSIYYAAGDSVEQLMKSPEIQIFLKKDIEVLLFTESMDEPCIQRVLDFDGKKFVSIQKGDVKLEQTEEEKKRETLIRKDFEPLTKWWKKILGDKVMRVEVSRRLVDAPCAVVASEWGYSAHMEKMMKSQTFADPRHLKMMMGQKVFEINPNHKFIQYFLELAQHEDRIKPRDLELATTLFEAAKLSSGFEVDNPKDIAHSIYKAIGSELGYKPMNEPLDDKDLVNDYVPVSTSEETDEEAGDEKASVDGTDEEEEDEAEEKKDEEEKKEEETEHDEL